MHHLLVVDDEPNVLYSLQKGLQSEQLTVHTARTAQQGLEIVRRQDLDAVILDVRLPDMSGLDALEQIRTEVTKLPVIVITAYASTNTAIEATKRGALEYLLKPVDLKLLRTAVGKALTLHERGNAEQRRDEILVGGLSERIVGRSAAMQAVYKAIGRTAPLKVTSLILGESGTGKELVAQAIHQYGSRSKEPFLAINCAAIPEALLESELFGHERGAFTGAEKRRVGKFEQVSGGTIFLDEIGDMTWATQAKVLRLLQEQQFERVGGNQTVTTDVRVIAATNQDLEALVAKGRFRQDLYYRLKGFTIQLPPLRKREGDVLLLIEHFTRQFNAELGKSVRVWSHEALQIMQNYNWPGNVRELQSAVKYALVQTAGELVTQDALPESLQLRACGLGEGGLPAALEDGIRALIYDRPPELYAEICGLVDKFVLGEVLREVNGNLVQASRMLGISRNTLRGKLRGMGLTIIKSVQDDGG